MKSKFLASSEGAAYEVTGTITDPGTAANEFTYTLNDNTKAGNYEIETVFGELKITKVTKEIVITAASDSKVYDGSVLTNSGYTFTEGVLAEGDELTAVVEGTVTDVGSAANVVTSYKVMRGETDVTANYTFGARSEQPPSAHSTATIRSQSPPFQSSLPPRINLNATS